jgi:hypothetical protein
MAPGIEKWLNADNLLSLVRLLDAIPTAIVQDHSLWLVVTTYLKSKHEFRLTSLSSMQ